MEAGKKRTSCPRRTSFPRRKSFPARKTAVAAAALVLALGLSCTPALAKEAVPAETVGFGGHEWWLVADGAREAEGFRPGNGKATLVAKNEDFDRSKFGSSHRYEGSMLQEAMGNAAAAALPEDSLERRLVVPRTLPGSDETDIAGEAAPNQLLWPLSKAEHEKLTETEKYSA
ncbi:MAG: hypothetical protein LBQ15_01505 [Clostridium sp.]|jgi:hypothetical protein|nr:hypothetical protein [Clostridium sp.]